MKTNRILLLEEDNDLRDSLVEFLSLQGHTLFASKHGQKGLNFALNKELDVIVCARKFEDADCLNILSALRKNPSTRQLPFILLSSIPNGVLHEEVDKDANSYVLVMPFGLGELDALIREVLR